ncbi:MAG: type II secretion system F family protein [Gemmataceae bacterium]|nr:type II secretion system F family protein [Gemmataceae bacterium]
MNEYLRYALVLGLAAAIAVIVVVWWRVHLLNFARARLAEAETPAADEAAPRARSIIRRWTVLPWLVAVLMAAGLAVFAGLPLVFAVAFGVVLGLILTQSETFRLARQTARIEEQLADAIDLMVAGLRVGAGATSALDAAARETRAPLKPQLAEMLGRIRYGDDPQAVLRTLVERVPLETFRLFTSALSVHWETGGSLAATLATVGRVIRDRVEVQRRIRALSTQARISTIAVLVVTYFIALIIWRNDPERMRQFLATSVGQYLAAGAIVLQAVGLVWASALSRLKY